MKKILVSYKKVLKEIKKQITFFEWLFYILLLADVLFLKTQNDLIYISLLLFYIFISNVKSRKSKEVYIFSLVLLSLSVVFSVIRLEIQADKFTDYALIYLFSRVLLDIKDLAIKGT